VVVTHGLGAITTANGLALPVGTATQALALGALGNRDREVILLHDHLLRSWSRGRGVNGGLVSSSSDGSGLGLGRAIRLDAASDSRGSLSLDSNRGRSDDGSHIGMLALRAALGS
jgi:hypothetical protein